MSETTSIITAAAEVAIFVWNKGQRVTLNTEQTDADRKVVIYNNSFDLVHFFAWNIGNQLLKKTHSIQRQRVPLIPRPSWKRKNDGRTGEIPPPATISCSDSARFTHLACKAPRHKIRYLHTGQPALCKGSCYASRAL